MKTWKRNLYRCVALLSLICFAFNLAGCGSLLYPKRLNQEPSNKIHAPTLIMDCLWLFVFIVPGVVALAVDFANGTVFYSEEELRSAGSLEGRMVVLIP